jgi:hypothetical protein
LFSTVFLLHPASATSAAPTIIVVLIFMSFPLIWRPKAVAGDYRRGHVRRMASS